MAVAICVRFTAGATQFARRHLEQNANFFLPKASFDDWLDEKPSRRHTGKTKFMRCNSCMQQSRVSATQLSQRDVDVVIKKRKSES